jgi:hypothetical protein
VSGISSAVFKDYKQATVEAIHNEMLTRQRVDKLEKIVLRGFWGRLKWLLLGR